MGHKERQKVRAENNDPINFTCGVCMQVHEFNEGLKCTNIEEETNGTPTTN